MTPKQETKAVCLSMISLFALFAAWVSGESIRRMIFEPMGEDSLSILCGAPIGLACCVIFATMAGAVAAAK